MSQKQNILYECQNCGTSSTKWLGYCVSCKSYDSYIQLNPIQLKQKNITQQKNHHISSQSTPTCIQDIQPDNIQKYSTNLKEFDLVLGGGIVPGCICLLGGSPGVGKSTLLLKIAGNIAQKNKKVLYVTGEESQGQVKLRASRLNANQKDLYLLSSILLEDIQNSLLTQKYELVIIDSIQTIYSQHLTSSAGSITQVRHITFELLRIAKEQNITIFIIGHITKEGSIAGPRVLEHMVDIVLYFEGIENEQLRLLRSFKNRFGSTSEIGLFQMSSEGLISSSNISSNFYNKTSKQSGSVLSVCKQGTRAIIIEIQALVVQSTNPIPKRSATGFDQNRLIMLIALLEKKLDLPLNTYDIFINISGGIKIKESAIDLAIIGSIISSLQNRPISKESIFLGEVSLTGEIKEINDLQTRLQEAFTHGIKKIILSKKPSTNIGTLKYYEVGEVSKMLELF